MNLQAGPQTLYPYSIPIDPVKGTRKGTPHVESGLPDSGEAFAKAPAAQNLGEIGSS